MFVTYISCYSNICMSIISKKQKTNGLGTQSCKPYSGFVAEDSTSGQIFSKTSNLRRLGGEKLRASCASFIGSEEGRMRFYFVLNCQAIYLHDFFIIVLLIIPLTEHNYWIVIDASFESITLILTLYRNFQIFLKQQLGIKNIQFLQEQHNHHHQ